MNTPLPSLDQRLYWALENCVELLKRRVKHPEVTGPAFTISIREAEKALRLARGKPEDAVA